MSRGDESDEEVYLSDPSDTDDTGSVEDYQYSDDSQAQAGFQEASQGDLQREIDYALHDAEVERASAAGPKAPEIPQPAGAVKSATTLSADAAPWVPPSLTGNSLKPHQPQSPANSGNLHDSKANPDSLKTFESKSDKSNDAPHKESQSESFKSPLDVGKIFQKLAESDSAKGDQPKADSSEAESSKAATPKENSSAAEVQKPGQNSADAEESKTKEAEAAEVNKPSSQERGANSVEKLNKDSENKVEANSGGEAQEEPSTQETKDLASELPSTSAALRPNESADSGPQLPSEEDAEKSNSEGKADEQPAQQSVSSSGEQEKEKPKGMPSLPQRNRSSAAPKGMPMLPARPARKTSQPTPSQGQSSTGESSKPDESSSQPQQETDSEPLTRPNTAVAQNPTSDSEGRGPQLPANGQRDRQDREASLAALTPQQAAPRPAPEQPAESEQVKKVREKLRQLRIQLFRLASRLGYSDHNLVRTIKYRLDQAERVRLDRSAAAEDLVAVAKDLEEQNSEEDIYTVTVMLLGITGSGKSATINSLLGYNAVSADAFEGTSNVTEVTNVEFGLKLRFIDTPGLEAAADSSTHNAKILKKIDKARKKYKPDLVIYCERMDILRRDLSDLPVLRQVTEVLGSEVWFNTLIIITHATSAGPLNREGQTLTFDQLSQTRAAMFQRALQGAIGDHRISAPTAFAENSPACPRNANGEAVLPNGLTWRKFVLMYLASIKVLREADNVLQVQAPKQTSAMNQLTMLLQAQRGMKLPPLPFLITNMIKHAGPKQYPDAERDILREDEIKAIKRFGLRRREWRKRTEFLKESHSRRRAAELPDLDPPPEADPYEPPGPGPALSPTFDSDENSFYYRSYEPKPGQPGWITRPRMEQNVTDHTDGVDSLTTERSFVKRAKDQELDGIPASVHAIIQKDKVNQLFQGGAEASIYQTWRIVHTGRAQVMTLSGGDVLWISQLESQLRYIPRNRLTLGGMVSRLSEEGTVLPTKGKVAMGMKLEDDIDLPDISQFNLKNNLKAGIGRGTIKLGQGRKEEAIGANAEYQLIGGKRENYQVMASFSQMKYRGNKGRQYALSGSVPVSEETTITPKLQLQSGGQGQISVRVASYDHSNIGLVVLVPLCKALYDKFQAKDEQPNGGFGQEIY